MQDIAMVTSALLGWVALVYLVMAAGSRSGELVWAGRQVRRLDPSLRFQALLYAVAILGSGVILVSVSGLLWESLIPDAWQISATFVASAFLILAAIGSLIWGSRWERMLFTPILTLGALVAGWMTLVDLGLL